MSQWSRTFIYLAVAAAALLVAWWARPAPDRSEINETGSRFFEPFDPLAAKSLEIVSFSQGASGRHAFKVAQQDGRWAIPSHEGYPADAQDHLGQAATSVMDLHKGQVVSDRSSDHELYGVVDPAASESNSGVGTRVTLQDDGGKTLVDLIIGKPVKDAPQLHYLRVPGKDRVYTATVNTDKLTTKFEEWIERDLLKLGPAQIKQVVIDDYSVDEVNNRINPGDHLILHCSPTDNQWSLEGLTDNEAVQQQKLQDMRAALADVRIIDVHRKPAGLSAQLQAGSDMRLDADAVTSLMSRGYFLVEGRQGSNQRELLSNEGEMAIRTGDGVVYALRFGEVINVEAGADLNEAKSEDGSEGQTPSGSEKGRYLFVTANFDPSLIEVPKYDTVPDALGAPASQPASEPADSAASQPAESQPAASQPSEAVTKAMQKARDAIIEANDQKRKGYEKKVADGQDKVKQLNVRFADWYYVVSDGVYQKLKLRRADVVGPKTEAPPAVPGTPGAPGAPNPNAPSGGLPGIDDEG